MKKHFITGLVILLPLTLTIVVVAFIFNFLTDPFVGIFRGILDYFDLLETGVLFWSADEVQLYASKIIILIFMFFLTVWLGALARWFFFRYLLRIWDYLLHRIPVVRTIYKTSQDVINTLFTSKANSFKQVVMVPFPNSKTFTIGLITRDNLPDIPKSGTQNLVAVFVPTTPNPTSGFLMTYKEEEIVYLDMKVEDAFKYIISCGVILTPFRAISKEESKKLNENEGGKETDEANQPIEP